jgi:hypothetical protein
VGVSLESTINPTFGSENLKLACASIVVVPLRKLTNHARGTVFISNDSSTKDPSIHTDRVCDDGKSFQSETNSVFSSNHCNLPGYQDLPCDGDPQAHGDYPLGPSEVENGAATSMDVEGSGR